MSVQKNYYGSLCTEMYEILHENAPEDELEFYLSYARKDQKILEPLCGSGRFLIPFLERGLDIVGMDLSKEMLDKLKEKAPEAKTVQCAIEEYDSDQKFDYIFISSGSVSLFTDQKACQDILAKMFDLLNAGGTFVFAVDSIACRCPDDEDYKPSLSVKTKEGMDLIMKGKNTYDETTQTQFGPAIYELYDQGTLLQSEPMDFQTHLYMLGEMESILCKLGFCEIKVYSSYDKKQTASNEEEMFLYECRK